MTDYIDLIDATQIPDKWIYNPSQLLAFVIGQTFAFSSPRILEFLNIVQISNG
jgi:hypothetical protein